MVADKMELERFDRMVSVESTIHLRGDRVVIDLFKLFDSVDLTGFRIRHLAISPCAPKHEHASITISPGQKLGYGLFGDDREFVCPANGVPELSLSKGGFSFVFNRRAPPIDLTHRMIEFRGQPSDDFTLSIECIHPSR